jgi:DNA-binding transcriptional regulator YhcF (GntR family)
LKRGAPDTRLPTSPKKQIETPAAKKRPGPLPAQASETPDGAGDAGPFDMDEVIDFLKREINRQMKTIQKTPSKTDVLASTRARDARTISDLYRTLERLNTLEKKRGKSGKAKPRDDGEIRENVVRKLDKLLAATGKRSVSAESQRG